MTDNHTDLHAWPEGFFDKLLAGDAEACRIAAGVLSGERIMPSTWCIRPSGRDAVITQETPIRVGYRLSSTTLGPVAGASRLYSVHRVFNGRGSLARARNYMKQNGLEFKEP
ncbi:TPA: hypothetical protein ACMFQN_005225 [Pseudomonas aeruginosa]